MALALAAPLAAGSDVAVLVLGLFHTQELELRAPAGGALRVAGDAGEIRLEGAAASRVRLAGGLLAIEANGRRLTGAEFVAAGDAGVRVALPGRIERTYRGSLRLRASDGEIEILARLPLEEAVAAVVEAEAGPAASSAAAWAQAVAARSYLAAGGRHAGGAFCDTTHCQHLTEAGPAARAAAERSRGAILTHGGRPLAARSTRRCGGRTHTLAQIGERAGGYPYFAVECEPCRREPSPWRRTLASGAAAEVLAAPGSEAARLAVVRRLGWSALPSNAYTWRASGEETVFEGAGEGHGAGLCQFGAAALAGAAWDGARILRHYFPNAAIETR